MCRKGKESDQIFNIYHGHGHAYGTAAGIDPPGPPSILPRRGWLFWLRLVFYLVGVGHGSSASHHGQLVNTTRPRRRRRVIMLTPIRKPTLTRGRYAYYYYYYYYYHSRVRCARLPLRRRWPCLDEEDTASYPPCWRGKDTRKHSHTMHRERHISSSKARPEATSLSAFCALTY